MAQAQHLRSLKSNELLFKEGDPSDSMYVVKKGRLRVFKMKGTAEVELAELGAGSMIGEMAFFDQKPRSAGIKAITDSEIIELPFKSLKTQYDSFPEWIKAIVKTINEHLRDANKKIKNLEQGESVGKDGRTAMQPHQANKLCAILMFVANKWGTPAEGGGIDVKPGQLRKFTIQVFQEPTSKMQTVMTILQGMGILKQEDLGEGRQRITLLQKDLLDGFVEWFNDYLFTEAEKKITLEQSELRILKAMIHFAKKRPPNDKGISKISLMEVQNDSMKDLTYLVGINDANSLITKGFLSDKIQEKDGTYVTADLKELERLYPYWQMFYALQG